MAGGGGGAAPAAARPHAPVDYSAWERWAAAEAGGAGGEGDAPRPGGLGEFIRAAGGAAARGGSLGGGCPPEAAAALAAAAKRLEVGAGGGGEPRTFVGMSYGEFKEKLLSGAPPEAAAREPATVGKGEAEGKGGRGGMGAAGASKVREAALERRRERLAQPHLPSVEGHGGTPRPARSSPSAGGVCAPVVVEVRPGVWCLQETAAAEPRGLGGEGA